MTHISEAKVVLFGLEASLSKELSEALRRCSNACGSLELQSSEQTLGLVATQAVDLVFCGPCLDTVKSIRSAAPNTSIVVVSRVPEVMDWLDAMEAGADDYCAPPFEQVHIRWILTNNLRPASMAA